MRAHGSRCAAAAALGAAGALLLAAGPAAAHEHWVDAESLRPAVGTAPRIFVRSGHGFPDSNTLLSEKVLQSATVRRPRAAPAPLDLSPGDDQWVGSVAVRTQGAHVVSFRLQRPRVAQPAWEGKLILTPGGPGADRPAAYVLGDGLELVPLTPLTELRAGGAISLKILLDGAEVGGNIELRPARGRGRVLRVAPGRPARAVLKRTGRYLATVRHGARGCSLVFEVPDLEREPSP